jgi:sugar lactone lactonase YvrE
MWIIRCPETFGCLSKISRCSDTGSTAQSACLRFPTAMCSLRTEPGGYSRLLRDGTVLHRLGAGVPGRQYVPNGIALAPDGHVLFADLGELRGGILAFAMNGEIRPLVEAIDGVPLPPTNFVLVDENERTWFTVSTRQRPRSLAWNPGVGDGFIGVIDEHGRRIVADGLGYTNEVAFSPNGRWLYVNETYAQRVS